MEPAIASVGGFLRRGLVRRSLWNGIGQIAPAIVPLALTPLVVSQIGIARYGVWALVTTVVAIATSLDGGIGASMVRFFGQHRARGDTNASSRLFFSSLLFALLFAAGISTLVALCADSAIGAVKVPEALVDDAVDALRFAGPLIGLAVLGNIPLSLLQAHDRFRVISLITTATTLGHGALTAVLILQHPSIGTLLLAMAVRLLVNAVGAIVASVPHLTVAGPLLCSRSEVVDVARYASRIQTSGVISLLNSQVDALVIAVVLPVQQLGVYALGYQAAWALRGVALWAMPPVASALFVAFGAGGRDEARRLFVDLNAVWQRTATVFASIGAAVVGFAVPAWLGGVHHDAGWVAAMLALAYAVNITSAVATSYLRAIGEPGVETRYGAVSVMINIVLTVPLALAFGLFGIVAATVVGTVLGTVSLPLLAARRGISELRAMLADVPMQRIVPAFAAALALELALLSLPLAGRPRLVMVAMPAVAVLAAALHGGRAELRGALTTSSGPSSHSALPADP